MLRSPNEWSRWVWIALLIALAVPLLLGARQLGAWPFGSPEPAQVSAPLPFAMKADLADVSARLKTVADASASKADVSELKAELDELKAVVKAISDGKGKRRTSTGSVK